MVGRPKNPNRPPTVTAVRLTERAYHKLLSHHIGNEPYGMTMERLIDELELLRKKVQALNLDIEGLHAELRSKETANTNLINMLKSRDTIIDNQNREIAYLKRQRKFMGGIQALEAGR